MKLMPFLLMLISINSFAQSKRDTAVKEPCDECIPIMSMVNYIAVNEEQKYFNDKKCVIIIAHDNRNKAKSKPIKKDKK